MHVDTAALTALLATYSYLLLFPLMIVEGPIVTIAAGFLVRLHIMKAQIAYPIVVAGDLTGDSLHYLLGYWGRHRAVASYLSYLGLTEERRAKLEAVLTKHAARTLITAKISHFMGAPFLVAAGLVNMRFDRFLIYNLIATLPKSACFMLVGFFLGLHLERAAYYLRFGSVIAITGTFVMVVCYLVISKYLAQWALKET